MADPGPVTRVLLDLTRTRPGDGRHLAAQICRSCVDGLDIDGAALSIMTGTAARQTLWASDAIAELVENFQYAYNEGPCMEAATTGHPVLVPDLRHGGEVVRWPGFAAAVIEQSPVGALFALPLQWGAANLGVLDLYRARAGGLGDVQWRDALGATAAAAAMLIDERTTGGGSLGHGSSHRVEIHQATGMVIAQLGLGPADALARLRAHAFATRSRLDDVARAVVEHRLIFTTDMP